MSNSEGFCCCCCFKVIDEKYETGCENKCRSVRMTLVKDNSAHFSVLPYSKLTKV